MAVMGQIRGRTRYASREAPLTRKDLPYDVAPGGTLSYALDAVVPWDPGVYTMTMGIVRGYEIICTMDVTVTVVY